MFTHLVLLKRSPWFIYAVDEKDALTYVGRFKDDLVGVAISEGGFEVKQPRVEIKLTKHVVEQIELDPTKAPLPIQDDEEAQEAEKMIDEILEEKE